jgi:hypothetical protein
MELVDLNVSFSTVQTVAAAAEKKYPSEVIAEVKLGTVDASDRTMEINDDAVLRAVDEYEDGEECRCILVGPM